MIWSYYTKVPCLITIIAFILQLESVVAFVSRKNNLSILGQSIRRVFLVSAKKRYLVSRSFLMRDASSAYWFKVGDTVRVVDDVQKAGRNLKGSMGKVIETWEKCDVDPTCCCAEFVDESFAVHVKFQDMDNSEFVHYFAEKELEKIKDVAFDGMSCQAFKLNQLKKRSS